MSIRYMIVDDEPIAHRIIQDYCSDLAQLELVNNSYNALEALAFLNHNPVDLIFLDINMPKLKGFDLLRTLKQPPQVIVTTAYQEYAIEGYELNVCDYLLKPFSLPRFLTAVNKAMQQIERAQQPVQMAAATPAQDSIFVKGDKKQHQVALDDILYIEACGNYAILHIKGNKIITQQTMAGFEQQLSPDAFIRIHKSFIVAKKAVSAIEANQVQVGKQLLPIGQTYKKALHRWIS